MVISSVNVGTSLEQGGNQFYIAVHGSEDKSSIMGGEHRLSSCRDHIFPITSNNFKTKLLVKVNSSLIVRPI